MSFMISPCAGYTGENFPKTQISNALIRAELMLPEPQIGSYRGARFDWSGIISSLQYQGHEYFGQWHKHHDPKIHDAVTEPLEEFRTNDSGLGYEEAKTGRRICANWNWYGSQAGGESVSPV
jgi:hypothetical protein